MPNQPRNQKASHGRKANPTPPLLGLPSSARGGCLASSALSLVAVLGLSFIPLCHTGMVPMRPLGVDRCSHEDQLFKKVPPI